VPNGEEDDKLRIDISETIFRHQLAWLRRDRDWQFERLGLSPPFSEDSRYLCSLEN